MIGAHANTAWVPSEIERDENGFLRTGRDLKESPGHRPPLPLETSLQGVFCAGDVRHGSIKRVASGVGEGSMATHLFTSTWRRDERVAALTYSFGGGLSPDKALWADLNDDRAHTLAAGILPIRLLDIVKREDGLNRNGDLPVSEPFEQLLQIRREALRPTVHAEECGSLPTEVQTLREQFEDRGNHGTLRCTGPSRQIHAVSQQRRAGFEHRVSSQPHASPLIKRSELWWRRIQECGRLELE